jgi:hypothetical protein
VSYLLARLAERDARAKGLGWAGNDPLR